MTANNLDDIDVLDLLGIEVRQIRSALDRVVSHYGQKPAMQRLEELRTAIDAINAHLERQEVILGLVEVDSRLRSDIQRMLELKSKIRDTMTHMVLSHVDETEFQESLLNELMGCIDELTKLEGEKLIASLREHISVEDQKAAAFKLVGTMI